MANLENVVNPGDWRWSPISWLARASFLAAGFCLLFQELRALIEKIIQKLVGVLHLILAHHDCIDPENWGPSC